MATKKRSIPSPIAVVALCCAGLFALDVTAHIGTIAACVVLFAYAYAVKALFILAAVLIPLVLGLAARDAVCQTRSLGDFAEILADLGGDARDAVGERLHRDR